MLRSVQGAAWVAALAALWAYALTLSPTVAWVNLGEDSGDLLAASVTLGIPHPTGYPLFVLLGRLATFLPVGSIAFRINLVAAVAAAVSVYALVRLACALAPEASRHWTAAFAAATCALLYASSRGAWSQSVLSEVYTLNAAFLAVILWLLVEAERDQDPRRLLLASYLFGLGLTNHLLLLAVSPRWRTSPGVWPAPGRSASPPLFFCLFSSSGDSRWTSISPSGPPGIRNSRGGSRLPRSSSGGS